MVTRSIEGGVREFLRGEASWEHLKDLGISVEIDGARIAVDSPPGVVVTARLEDVARGFLTLKGRFQDLRNWASLLLSGSSFLELDQRFETDPRGETLLEALWDATFGTRPGPNAEAAARELVSPGGTSP